MTHLCLSSFSIPSLTKLQPTSYSIPKIPRNIITSSLAATNMSDQTKLRRSGNYQPTIWSNDYIQSINTQFSRGAVEPRIKELKSEVKKLLKQSKSSEVKVELIVLLQRLGLEYQFEDNIKQELEIIYNDNFADNTKEMKEDLHVTALQFRLLREYGYRVSQDIFNTFKDEKGDFQASVSEDIEGVLSLYEACFVLEDGESILEDARLFTTKCLKKFIEESKGHGYHSTLASHALELPLRWRMPRLEARWFIDFYERHEKMNPLLLELAKLDFNHVQATYLEELKYMSRWWNKTGLGEELSFARDRLMECFFWTTGIVFRPDLTNARRVNTKVNALITTIDDVYDVYGTLDELEQFTTAIERWNIDAMEQLPNYMKLCFLTLYNFVNELGFDILKEQQVNIIPHLKKVWLDLCKSYMVEAKWYYNGYTPTLKEYLDNAWISIGGHVILFHNYSCVASSTIKDTVEIVADYPPILKWSAMILRLTDDLGTSSDELKRGDVPKSIQCYMAETGASESEAREYIYYLIDETWKKINKDHSVARSMYPTTFVDIAIDLARMAICMYQNGDGHASQHAEVKHRIFSLLINAISIN